MSKQSSLVFITQDSSLRAIADRLLADEFRTAWFSNMQSSLDYIYNSFPDLLVLTDDVRDSLSLTLLEDLKSDPIFGRLPILYVVSGPHAAEFPGIPLDDFVRLSQLGDDLLPRIRVCLYRSRHVFEVNPLTRLPGNIAIFTKLQERLDRQEVFGLAYTDLDYFKPYNDLYGFGRGDEILKMVGRLITNIVRAQQPQGSFVGHIGGDDFVFIMTPDLIERAAEEIILNFDRIVPTFYDAEHRQTKSISSRDREGKERTFPFISLSIGITSTRFHSFTHAGEMSEVASEMKKFAKQFSGSCVKVDKRRTRDKEKPA